MALTVLPFLIFTGFSIWLSVIDLKTHRLPNLLTLLTGVLVAYSIWITGNNLAKSVKISIFYFLVFLLIAILKSNSIGFGDVKFSISCGLVVGYYIYEKWLLVLWLMFALAGGISLVLILLKRLTKSDRIAFGPFMATAVALTVINSLVSGQL